MTRTWLAIATRTCLPFSSIEAQEVECHTLNPLVGSANAINLGASALHPTYSDPYPVELFTRLDTPSSHGRRKGIPNKAQGILLSLS